MWWFIYWFYKLDKNKKAAVKPKNEDDKCSQYAAAVALNYEVTKCNPARVSNIKQFIHKYNWEGIKYPSKIDDWKKFEKNNLTVTLNILFIKEKEICPAYISIHSTTHEKQIILLMIPIKEKEG